MKIKGSKEIWSEITRDFADRDEAVAALRHYREQDAGWATTRLARKRDGSYVVIQYHSHGASS